MSKIGKSLIQGALEALDYAKGQIKGTKAHKIKVPLEVDVAVIRNNLHMSRQQFSDEFGFSIRTLEKWERKERVPEAPVRAYLTVISQNPSAVMYALKHMS